jgi:6-phosphogluconolactonase
MTFVVNGVFAKISAAALVVVAGLSFLCSTGAAQASYLYVANSNSTISIYSVNGTTGNLTDVGVASIGTMSSSFSLAVNPQQTFLYVGDNTGRGTWGFAIGSDGATLTPLDGSPFPISYMHSAAVDPTGTFLVAAHPGNVSSYRIDPETGSLMLASYVIGGTPWSVSFEPTGQYVYVANVNSNTVSGFGLDPATGELTTVPGSPFGTGANPQRVAIDLSGRFVYASNGNGASISAYTIDAETGSLSQIAGSPFATTAAIPEPIIFDPTGNYLYVSTFSNINAFTIDQSTGALTPLDGSPFPSGDSMALDLAMDPTGQFVYAASHDAKKVTVFARNLSTGALSISSAAASPGFPLAIAMKTVPAP